MDTPHHSEPCLALWSHALLSYSRVSDLLVGGFPTLLLPSIAFKIKKKKMLQQYSLITLKVRNTCVYRVGSS